MRSLPKNKNKIEELINEVESYPDILATTDTKLNQANINRILPFKIMILFFVIQTPKLRV